MTLYHVYAHTNKDALWFQTLYGRRTRLPPDLCSDSTFDAIFQYPAGVIYVLKGKGDTVQGT
jgi:hypothetical protein